MLLELFKLYKKNGASKTPLEDFTTEAFAGLLKLHPTFFEGYQKLLVIPPDNYRIVTQQYYFLFGTMDCNVDMVLIGHKNVCMIENKVHSGEGWEQLNRYNEALIKNYPNHKTYLRYCTKYEDLKHLPIPNFQQITWWQVGKLINKKSNKSLIDFHQFLKYHNMADNYDIDLETLISIKRMRDSIKMVHFHLNSSKQAFLSSFGNAELVNQTKLNAINDHDRFGYLYKNILEESDNWTELLYCIHLGTIELVTQIFINKVNQNYNKVIDRLQEFNNFTFIEIETGMIIILSKKMTDLIEDEYSDQTIKSWFNNSFIEFAKLISMTPDLKWKIQANNVENGQ